jgi:hypothetical protein
MGPFQGKPQSQKDPAGTRPSQIFGSGRVDCPFPGPGSFDEGNKGQQDASGGLKDVLESFRPLLGDSETARALLDAALAASDSARAASDSARAADLETIASQATRIDELLLNNGRLRIAVQDYRNRERPSSGGFQDFGGGPRSAVGIQLPDDLEGLKEKLRQALEELDQTRQELARSEDDKKALFIANKELQKKLDTPGATPDNSGISPSKAKPGGRKAGPKPQDGPEGPGTGRGQGGQPGHKAHIRIPFGPDWADHAVTNDFAEGAVPPCPCCGGVLARHPESDATARYYDLPEKPAVRVAETSLAYKCAGCGKIHYSGKPQGRFRRTIVSMLVVAMVIILRVRCMLPIRRITGLCRDWLKIGVSDGFVVSCLTKAAYAMMPVYLELVDSVRLQEWLAIDETVWKLKGKQRYMWIFRGISLVVFRFGTRSRDMLDRVVRPAFGGAISCDRYAAYISYAKEYPETVFQFCLAHLLRDFQFCADHLGPDFESVRKFGENGVRLVKELIHAYNSDSKARAAGDVSSEAALIRQGNIFRLRDELMAHGLSSPDVIAKSRGIGKQFKGSGESYFTFLSNPLVPPTNNDAERGLRELVCARKMSFFSQSLSGICAVEVFYTILGTLKLKEIDAVSWLVQALTAASNGKPLSSLVNVGNPVDPKYVQEAVEELKGIKGREAAAKREAALKKQAGVKPFADAGENVGGTDGKEGARPSPPEKKGRTRSAGTDDPTSRPEYEKDPSGDGPDPASPDDAPPEPGSAGKPSGSGPDQTSPDGAPPEPGSSGKPSGSVPDQASPDGAPQEPGSAGEPSGDGPEYARPDDGPSNGGQAGDRAEDRPGGSRPGGRGRKRQAVAPRAGTSHVRGKRGHSNPSAQNFRPGSNAAMKGQYPVQAKPKRADAFSDTARADTAVPGGNRRVSGLKRSKASVRAHRKSPPATLPAASASARADSGARPKRGLTAAQETASLKPQAEAGRQKRRQAPKGTSGAKAHQSGLKTRIA